MDGKCFDVVGLGACSIDLLGVTPGYPARDTKNRMTRFVQQGGGLVATALVALARLGARTSFLGKFGDDSFSRMALDEFAREGVDTNRVVRRDGAGPYIAFISVAEDSGARTIWWTDEMVCPVQPEEIPEDWIVSARVLHLDEYNAPGALRAAEIARSHGVTTVLDAETPGRTDLAPLIALTDYLIVPESFAAGYTGKDPDEAPSGLLAAGPKVVVVTRGARGCTVTTARERFARPAFQVPVVDTTGCGDVFHGAFIYGILRDWPLAVTAEFASAVAALKCGKMGGRAGCPDLAGVREFLDSRGTPEIKKSLKGDV